MSRTRKDSRAAKLENWESVRTPSWWNKSERKRQRNLARKDLQRGKEPLLDYGDIWYW